VRISTLRVMLSCPGSPGIGTKLGVTYVTVTLVAFKPSGVSAPLTSEAVSVNGVPAHVDRPIPTFGIPRS
jgi:hypothetical protein